MSRFHLRNKPRISYYEPDEPNLDEYVFCSHCGDFVYEYCSIHGPLLVIPDDKFKDKRIGHYIMNIGAGLGVFTTLTLPSGVRFGPYEGKKTEEITSMYCWQINDYDNKRIYVIDAEDPNKSNWMRYVNCSRHWYEQNLIAYQYRGRLYYRTIKIIPRYTELMVFYGSEFAHRLQINLKNYNAPTGYAQKYGAPLPKYSLSEGSKNNEISLSTNCLKKESINSSQITENTSKLSNTQDNEEPNDVSNLQKNIQVAPKKVKFNAPKKIQKDKDKTPKTSNKRKNKTNNTKNIMPDKKNQTADITMQSKEKLNIQSCDFDSNENIKTKRFKQLSKKSYKNNVKTTDINENKSEHVSILEKNNNINNKSTEEKIDDSFQSKTFLQKSFSCDRCNFKTSIEKYLKTHLLAHGGKTKYTCTYCDHITKFRRNLNRHIRTHTGEKPYPCQFCEKKFNRKFVLNSHIRTHTGEKPYACNFCDKKFNQKANLNYHIRSHTGEKPYACKFCEKKFNDKGYLNCHIRSHTGEKPYACKFCEKKFNDKGYLNCHIRSHTGEKPYACQFCEKKFSWKNSLRYHIKTLHTQ